MNMEPLDDHDDLSSLHLHDLLMTARVPQTRVDLTAVISKARRQRRMSHIAASLAVVLVVSGAAAYATTDPMRAGPADEPTDRSIPVASCSVEQMNGPYDNPDWTLLGMDHAGRYLLGSILMPGTTSQPTGTASWIWDGNAWQPTAGLPTAPTSFGGPDLLAGDRLDPLRPTTPLGPWVRRGGASSDLTLPPGYVMVVTLAVNARGDVLGLVAKADQGGEMSRDLNGRALALWPASAPGTVRLLQSDAAPLVSSSKPDSLADDGTVAGTVRNAPVIWRPDGARSNLPLPKGSSTGSALAIRGRYVYGVVGAGADQRLTAWNLRTGKVHTIRAGGGKLFLELSGTADGRVLDYSMPGAPVLVDLVHGRLTRLPLPDGSQSGSPVVRTAFISDDGKATVAAVGMPQGGERVFAWHC